MCPANAGQEAGIEFAGGLKPEEVLGLWREPHPVGQCTEFTCRGK